MKIVQEQNHINRYNELKIIYNEVEVPEDIHIIRLIYSRKKIKERYYKNLEKRKEVYQLIQFYQLQILKLGNIKEDNISKLQKIDREIRNLTEFVDMKIVELHSLDREIKNMENEYSFL